MTRQRPPLSIDAAMSAIMVQLGGWPAVANAAGVKSARTCEKWGAFDIADPDDPEARDIPMRAAVKLDMAYQAAGGIGAPIFEAYGDMVRSATAERFGNRHELQRETISFIRETHDAVPALLEAGLPDASAAEDANAQRELLQVRQWIDRLLIRLGRKPP